MPRASWMFFCRLKVFFRVCSQGVAHAVHAPHHTIVPAWRASVDRPKRPEPSGWFLRQPEPSACAGHPGLVEPGPGLANLMWASSRRDSSWFSIRNYPRRRSPRELFPVLYRIGREPMMRISTSRLALCGQSGPDATLETPIRARSRSSGSRSGRMSPLLIARSTSA